MILKMLSKDLKKIGINKLLTICTTFESFEKIKIILNKDPILFMVLWYTSS